MDAIGGTAMRKVAHTPLFIQICLSAHAEQNLTVTPVMNGPRPFVDHVVAHHMTSLIIGLYPLF